MFYLENSNKAWGYSLFCMEKGITLIALVITVIVLLILAGVTIETLTGDNGIITKAAEAAFRTEMAEIKEQVELREIQAEMDGVTIQERFTKVSLEDLEEYDADLKKEIVYWGQYDIGVSEITKEYAKNNWRDILTEERLANLYIVDKETAGGKEKTYLYDVKEQIVYKIPITKIGKYGVHSVEELNDCRGESNDNIISDDSKMVTVDGVSYYEPNLAGFNLDKTSIVYYEVSENIEESITLTAKEYISGGKPRTIEKEGKTYEFYNYKTQKWANILVENSGMQSYWTWIPRYCYNQNDVSDIKFIDIESTPEEGYILHSDFEDGKKGMWASKYEPISTANAEVSNFPYYIPDLTGFNKENTYAEVYNSKENKFEETQLSKISNITDFARKNNWFNYNEQVWANIRVYEPESKTETWWVWIPRYAYSITSNETSIIFIDLNNKPLDGSTLPSNYVVHSAFENDKKGIWVSKYEPVEK